MGIRTANRGTELGRERYHELCRCVTNLLIIIDKSLQLNDITFYSEMQLQGSQIPK